MTTVKHDRTIIVLQQRYTAVIEHISHIYRRLRRDCEGKQYSHYAARMILAIGAKQLEPGTEVYHIDIA